MKTSILYSINYWLISNSIINDWFVTIMFLLIICYLLSVNKQHTKEFNNTDVKKNSLNEVTPFIINKKTVKRLSIEEIFFLSQQDDFLKKCIKITQTQLLNEQFDVPFLAKEMYMVRVTLYRELKKRTGRTAITFIKLVRLRKAHKLLMETNYSIADIAYQVGFKAPSHFSTSYKKEYGHSPKQMRANIAKNKIYTVEHKIIANK